MPPDPSTPFWFTAHDSISVNVADFVEPLQSTFYRRFLEGTYENPVALTGRWATQPYHRAVRWDTLPRTHQGEIMFDIVVTETNPLSSQHIYDLQRGTLSIAVDGVMVGNVLLSVSSSRFLNLSKMDGVVYNVNDYNFLVRELAPSAGVTLIVR